jgi:hypothetical protein
MKSKLGVIFLIAILLLSGCSSTDRTPAPSPSDTTANTDESKFQIPSSCDLSGVNSGFAKIIPPSKYIPTEWTPAEGTDLAAVLNNGGIACSYGDQDAEVGGTVMWVKNVDGLWDSQVKKWQAEGLESTDIPGINESAAFKLPEGATSVDGMPAWRINILIDDLWIQLGAAFIQSYEEATPIIEAAINAATK